MKRVRSSKKEKSDLIDPKKLSDIEDLHRVHIDRIRQMRAGGNAPVDTMGCHKLADPLATPEVFRFQVLVSLMLSSQTRDQTNAAAMLRLKQHGLNIESMIAIDVKELENLLVPVSFFRRKAVNIKKVAQILKDDFNGDVPNTVEGLCSLPGVGPKMSHLVMQIAWNQVEGVAVDVHVHRIANRLGWMKTTKPEETRERLQEMLPRSEWEWINPLLVGFGQTICLPLRPKCSECLCRLICPSSTDRKPEEAPV